MPKFKVVSPYEPSGDQPEAIEKLAQGIENGLDEQILLGVTGSGKTFTMAKVIERIHRPTLLLRLVPLLAEKSRERTDGPVILNSTERAGEYLLRRFDGKKHELVYELCMDRKGKLLACKLLTEGDVNGAELNIRRLVENALLTNASAVILSHNHPSGVALPSSEDFATTDRARAALEGVGIPMVDHIIVADGDFVSMRDSGYFTK